MQNKEYMQKQLIVSNLRELHQAFKKYPLVQIGFPKFYSLRLKWCVFAGASGTHSVYVYFIHQNVKLLADALSNSTSYKALFKLLVCDDKKRECMMRQCDQCPDDSELRAFSSEVLQRFNDISFK